MQDEEPLTLVMKGIAADLAQDTLFYFATEESRFDWKPNERDWYKEAVANHQLFTFTEPYVDARTGKLCATFSQAVVTKNGKLFGVAALDVMLGFFADLFLQKANHCVGNSWVELLTLVFIKFAQDNIVAQMLSVRAISVHSIVSIGYRNNSCGKRNFLAD